MFPNKKTYLYRMKCLKRNIWMIKISYNEYSEMKTVLNAKQSEISINISEDRIDIKETPKTNGELLSKKDIFGTRPKGKWKVAGKLS